MGVSCQITINLNSGGPIGFEWRCFWHALSKFFSNLILVFTLYGPQLLGLTLVPGLRLL